HSLLPPVPRQCFSRLFPYTTLFRSRFFKRSFKTILNQLFSLYFRLIKSNIGDGSSRRRSKSKSLRSRKRRTPIFIEQLFFIYLQSFISATHQQMLQRQSQMSNNLQFTLRQRTFAISHL